jgi:hypothetical protein
VVDGERAQPAGLALVEAGDLEVPIAHYSNSRWGPAIGDAV